MKSNKNIISSTVFISLSLVDYLTTKKILKDGGIELNPIANFFIRKKLFGLFKIITTIFGSLSIYHEGKKKEVSKFLLPLYGITVANNINQIINDTKRNIKKND